MLLLTAILISILLVVIVAYLLRIRKIYSFFDRLNIPGPKPAFFFGNFADIAKTKRVSVSIKQWTEKYGRIFGYFEGHTPILVISDPDVLQDVFIKSFSNFHSRRSLPLEDVHARDVHVFSAPGLRWKRQRSVITPTFSSAKLKQMTPLIHHSIDAFMSKMAEVSQKNEPFDIYTYFQRFTMDTIWSCAFSIDTDMQNDVDNPYLVHSQQVFDEMRSPKVLILLSLFITELNALWYKLHHFEISTRYWLRHYFPFIRKFLSADPEHWIIKQISNVIKKREGMGSTNRVDLLQLMLDSVSNEDFIQDRHSASVKMDLTDNEPQLIRKLTRPEISLNTYLFMIAGYETTSTALAYMSLALATNPSVQHKLQENIDTHFDPETEQSMPSYDTVMQMDYLDMFIRETLRMYPIAPIAISRQNFEDFHIKNFGTIPAGTAVTVDIYQLHFDPDLWGPVDPHIFHPERFASKRHPMAWIPFGAGPRNCVGMRFALTELKLILTRLLKTYSIINCEEQTQQSFENLKEFVVIKPDQVIIRLQRRDE